MEWFVRRRYPANLATLKKKIVDEKTCLCSMKDVRKPPKISVTFSHNVLFSHQVSLFSRWQESTIEAFIDTFSTPHIVRLEAGHKLASASTPPDAMFVLLRGRCETDFQE